MDATTAKPRRGRKSDHNKAARQLAQAERDFRAEQAAQRDKLAHEDRCRGAVPAWIADVRVVRIVRTEQRDGALVTVIEATRSVHETVQHGEQVVRAVNL